MSRNLNRLTIAALFAVLAGCEPTGNQNYGGQMPQLSGDMQSMKEQLKSQYSRDELIQAKDQMKAEFNAMSPEEQGLVKSLAKAWRNGEH